MIQKYRSYLSVTVQTMGNMEVASVLKSLYYLIIYSLSWLFQAV